MLERARLALWIDLRWYGSRRQDCRSHPSLLRSGHATLAGTNLLLNRLRVSTQLSPELWRPWLRERLPQQSPKPDSRAFRILLPAVWYASARSPVAAPPLLPRSHGPRFQTAFLSRFHNCPPSNRQRSSAVPSWRAPDTARRTPR